MQTCITGANGFIGRKLVDFLSKEGHSVRILTRKHRPEFPANVEVVIGDLTKPDCDLARFINGCEVLFHCAGEVRNISLMRLLHVEGTKRLIQSATDYCFFNKKVIHWVQLSSCGAYGPPVEDTEADRVITEASPCHPANEYEITKTISDNLLIGACRSNQMSYAILRPSNVFGSSMTNQSLRKIVNMVKHGRFFFLGRPGAVATYVHVDDVVAALFCLATNPRAKGGIYNLSNDCTFEELIKRIAFLMNVSVPTLRIPARLIRLPISVLATLLKGWIHIPKLDALVSRTRYPAIKIQSELGFGFSMPMPDAIEELTVELSW